ncbi:MAG: thiamine phosphate synthase [Pseudomonadota bacterium]
MSSTLPAHYMITGKFAGHADFQGKLERALQSGPKVVQLRCKGMGDTEYLELARLAETIRHRFEAPLFLATTVELFAETGADGLHLSSDRLGGLSERPIAADKLLSVSCHTEADLELADRLGADILLLSPVKPTASHPDLPGLGWERFREMTEGLDQPVYGLGGMQPEDVDDAQAAGARGIAATAGYWS